MQFLRPTTLRLNFWPILRKTVNSFETLASHKPSKIALPSFTSPGLIIGILRCGYVGRGFRFLHSIVLFLTENLFNITVYTADLKLAGTTSRVYINIYGMLYGLQESTAKSHLTNHISKEFKRGRWVLMIHPTCSHGQKSWEEFAHLVFLFYTRTPNKHSRVNATALAQSLLQCWTCNFSWVSNGFGSQEKQRIAVVSQT